MKTRLQRFFGALLTVLTVSFASFAQNVDVEATAGTPTGSYPTLNAAFAAINDGTHNGDVIVKVVNSHTITTTATLNAAAPATSVIIRPDDAASSIVTLSGSISAFTPLVQIRRGNVTIDGRPGGSGTSRFLGISNSAIQGTALDVSGVSNAITNVVVRNLVLTGSSDLTQNNQSTGIDVGTNVSGTCSQTGTVITNNLIQNCSWGIWVQAGATNTHADVSVTNNIIQDFIRNGLSMSAGAANITGSNTISGNIVRHTAGYTPAPTASTPWTGINIVNTGAGSTWNFIGNQIYGLKTAWVTTANAQLHRGVVFQNSGVGATLNFVNNYVGLTETNAGLRNQQALYGATIQQATGAGTINVRNNTFIVGGNAPQTLAAAIPSVAVQVNSNVPGSTFRFKNNIAVNSRITDNVSAGHGVAWFSSLMNLPTTVEVDYNLYWKPTTNNQSFNMLYVSTGRAWAAHRAAFQTTWPGIEANSDFLEITYPTANSPVFASVFNRNFELLRSDDDPALTTDIFGTTRPVNYYKGAYEGDPFYTNDLRVVEVYTLGKLPLPYGAPHEYRVAIRNAGAQTVSGSTASLSITGANTYGPTVVNLPDIAPLQTVVVALDTLEEADYAVASGSQNVTFAVQDDQNNSNNSRTINQDMSVNSYNYAYRVPPAAVAVSSGGVGFNSCVGCKADFVAKFLCSSPTDLNQVKAYFNGTNATATYQVVVYAADGPGGIPGTLLYLGPLQTRPGAPTATAVAEAVLSIEPAVPVSGNFFVGIRQRSTDNIGFAYQTESPARPNSFYYIDSTAATPEWIDFAATNSGFKVFVEPRLRVTDDLGATALLSPALKSCYGPAQTLTVEVKNLGVNTIDFSVTPATVSLAVSRPQGQGLFTDTVMITSGVISTDQTVTVDFTMDMILSGTYSVNAKAEYANDLVPENDAMPTAFRTVARYQSNSYPLLVSFNPTGTNVPNFQITSETVTTGGGWAFAASKTNFTLAPQTGTGVVQYDAFNRDSSDRARLILPCTDLSTFNGGVLQFNIARDSFDPIADSVDVVYSTDGGNTWSSSIRSIRRYDATLPANTSAWQQEQVVLPVGALTNVRLGFEATSAGGIGEGLATALDFIRFYQCLDNGTWLGTTEDWFDATNWCDLQVPTAATNVRLNDFAPKAPVIDAAGAICNNLTLGTNKELFIDAAGTLQINGNLSGTNSGIEPLALTGGRVIFGGASVVNVTQRNLVFNEVELLDNAFVSLTGTSRLLPLNVLYMGDNSTLTVAGTSRVYLTSDEIGTTNIITGSNASIIGNVEYRRFFPRSGSSLPYGGYWNVSLPITNWTPATFGTGGNTVRVASEVINGQTFGANFWLYDATRAPDAELGWYNPASLATNVGLGTGARAWLPAPRFWLPTQNPTRPAGTYVYTGTQLNTGNSFDWSSLLKFCPGGCTYTEPNGYNLIGNPFPAVIDWDAAGWTRTDVEPNIWIFNGATQNYGTYIAGDGGVGTNGVTNQIANGQGFWVRANSATPTLAATGAVRVDVFRGIVRGGNTDSRFRINVKNEAQFSSDEVIVRFREGATRSYDRGMDATKLDGPYMNVALVPVAGSRLSIGTMPLVTPTTREEIVLEVSSNSTAGTFNLTASGFYAMEGVKVYLKDNFRNTLTELTEGAEISFSFTSDPESRRTGRFVIVYGSESALSLSNQVTAAKAEVSVYPNPSTAGNLFTVSVANWSTEGAVIRIVDMMGRQVYTENISVTDGKAVRHIGAQLPAGVYNVVVNSKDGETVTQRISIN